MTLAEIIDMVTENPGAVALCFAFPIALHLLFGGDGSSGGGGGGDCDGDGGGD